MLALLGWILVAVAGLALLALSLPVRVRIAAETGPPVRLRVHAAPLGGLVPEFALPGGGAPGRGRPGRHHGRPRLRVIRGVPALIGEVLARIRLLSLSAEGTYGLGDPAATGEMAGMLAPLVRGIPTRGRAGRIALDLSPDFERAGLVGSAEALISVTPMRLVPPLARFAWTAFGKGRGWGRA